MVSGFSFLFEYSRTQCSVIKNNMEIEVVYLSTVVFQEDVCSVNTGSGHHIISGLVGFRGKEKLLFCTPFMFTLGVNSHEDRRSQERGVR